MGNIRYTNGFDVTIHKDLFSKPLEWKKPKMIFVNSMSDLFHENIPSEEILELFSIMNKAYWHTFQVLTKRTERLIQLTKDIVWTNNIWMGVSVENKKVLSRVDALLRTNAHIKFVSAEPLLESIGEINLSGIDWLIVGGESGVNCRPLKKEWVIELRDKARETETAFFFKQWGGFHHNQAGSMLDGMYYKEYPQNKLNIV